MNGCVKFVGLFVRYDTCGEFAICFDLFVICFGFIALYLSLVFLFLIGVIGVSVCFTMPLYLLVCYLLVMFAICLRFVLTVFWLGDLDLFAG